MNLEQTIKKSLGKVNRSSRVGNPIVSNIVVYSLAGLLIGGLGCGSDSEQDSLSDNVSISSGTTNSEGKTVFTDKNTEETVNVFVSGEEGFPIANTKVTFFDGDNFEMFYLEEPKSGYIPKLKMFPHNSDHYFKLTNINTAPWTIEDYDGGETYVKSVEEWLKERGAYNGCWTKEEIKKKNMAYTLILGPVLGFTKIANVVKGGQSSIGDLGIEIADYNHEYFITPKPGEGYFGSIMLYSPFIPSSEKCNDLDDDCDKKTDEDGVCETSGTTGAVSDSECFQFYTHCNSNGADCHYDCTNIPFSDTAAKSKCGCNCYKEQQNCCKKITCTPTEEQLATVDVICGDMLQTGIKLTCK